MPMNISKTIEKTNNKSVAHWDEIGQYKYMGRSTLQLPPGPFNPTGPVMPFPVPATATEFKALVLDWLHGRVDLGISDEDACEAFQNMSDNYLSFDEWEQFCIQNDMA